MKLSQLHTGQPPLQKTVIQPEEHQGAKHPRRWYQRFARPPKPYHQSKTTGPKPEEYNRYILR